MTRPCGDGLTVHHAFAELTTYPNIGDKLAAELRRVGIDTYEILSELGSVEAAYRIAGGKPLTGYNFLYALEGAIKGMRWHSLSREERARVKADYDRRVSQVADVEPKSQRARPEVRDDP